MEKNNFKKLFQNYFAEKYPINNFPREILDIISNYSFSDAIPKELFYENNENNKNFYRTFVVKNKNEKKWLEICLKKIFKDELVHISSKEQLVATENNHLSSITNLKAYKTNCLLTKFTKSRFDSYVLCILGKRALYSFPDSDNKLRKIHYFYSQRWSEDSPSMIYIILTEGEYHVIMNNPMYGCRARLINKIYRWTDTNFLEWISKLPMEEINPDKIC